MTDNNLSPVKVIAASNYKQDLLRRMVWSFFVGLILGILLFDAALALIAFMIPVSARTNTMLILSALAVYLPGIVIWYFFVGRSISKTWKRGCLAGILISLTVFLLMAVLLFISLAGSGSAAELGPGQKNLHAVFSGPIILLVSFLFSGSLLAFPLCCVLGSVFALAQGASENIAKSRRLRMLEISVLTMSIIVLLALGSYYGLPYSGVVIDKQSGLPVEGAAIVISWERYVDRPTGKARSMEGIKETVTDAQGRFFMRNLLFAPRSLLSSIDEEPILVYRPGYKLLYLDERSPVIKLEALPTYMDARKSEAGRAKYRRWAPAVPAKPDQDDGMLHRVISKEEEFIDSMHYAFRPEPVNPARLIRGFIPSAFAYSQEALKRSEKCAAGSEDCDFCISMFQSYFREQAELERAEKRFHECRRTLRVITLPERKATAYFYKSKSEPLVQYRDEYEPNLVYGTDDCSSVDEGKPAISTKNRKSCYVRIITDRNRNERVRAMAAKVLGIIKDPDAVNPLIDMLSKDRYYGTQKSSARALGFIGDQRAIPALIDTLKDEKSYARNEATRALGNFKDVRVTDALISALRESSVRREARESLGRIGNIAMDTLLASLKDEAIQEDIAVILGKITDPDPKAIEPLTNLVSSKKHSTSYEAVTALGNFKNQDAIKALVSVLKSNNEQSIMVASKAICRIGPMAFDELFARFQEADQKTRRNFLFSLGCTKDSRAVKMLIDLWNDPDKKIRVEASGGLVEAGSQAVNPLIAELGSNISYNRWRAAWCLGRIGDSSALEALGALKNDKASEVRWTAVDALERIKDLRSAMYLAGFCNDSDAGIKDKAVSALFAKVGMDEKHENVQQAQPEKRRILSKPVSASYGAPSPKRGVAPNAKRSSGARLMPEPTLRADNEPIIKRR
jgi:HEAT repeat protein